MSVPSAHGSAPDRRPRAYGRVTLGLAQLFAAAFSALLLFDTGINRWSLLAVVVTCCLTTTSVLVFGKR